MTKLPFTDSYIPSQHLGQEGHFVPAKARQTGEIARRHAMPRGSLRLEHQYLGLGVLGFMYEQAAVPRDRKFVAKIAGMTLLNSAWFTYAQNAPVMNRRQKLEKLVDHETDERMTADTLYTRTSRGLEVAQNMAQILLAKHKVGNVRKSDFTAAGRHMGNVSLQFTAIEHNATNLGGDAVTVQKEYRDMAQQTVGDSRTFINQIGVHPTVMQLADPYSPLSLFIRHEAPTPVLNAQEIALANQ